MEDNNIQIFEDKKIRTAWNESEEEWYFSVVDVVGVLTDQPNQRGASNYWAKLKQRLRDEGADQGAVALSQKSPCHSERSRGDSPDRGNAAQRQKGCRPATGPPKRKQTSLLRGFLHALRLVEMTFSDNNRLMRQPLENGCAGREAEATTTEISREQNPQTFAENRSVAREGGEVAGNARKDIEERTGRPVITSRNAEDFSNLISEIIEKDYSEKEGK